jgi:hypothetical protein
MADIKYRDPYQIKRYVFGGEATALGRAWMPILSKTAENLAGNVEQKFEQRKSHLHAPFELKLEF